MSSPALVPAASTFLVDLLIHKFCGQSIRYVDQNTALSFVAVEWIAGVTLDQQHIDKPFTHQEFAIVVSHAPRRFITRIIVKTSTLQCKVRRKSAQQQPGTQQYRLSRHVAFMELPIMQMLPSYGESCLRPRIATPAFQTRTSYDR